MAQQVAKIKDGQIVNVEMWELVPSARDGFTYSRLSTAQANGLPYADNGRTEAAAKGKAREDMRSLVRTNIMEGKPLSTGLTAEQAELLVGIILRG